MSSISLKPVHLPLDLGTLSHHLATPCADPSQRQPPSPFALLFISLTPADRRPFCLHAQTAPPAPAAQSPIVSSSSPSTRRTHCRGSIPLLLLVTSCDILLQIIPLLLETSCGILPGKFLSYCCWNFLFFYCCWKLTMLFLSYCCCWKIPKLLLLELSLPGKPRKRDAPNPLFTCSISSSSSPPPSRRNLQSRRPGFSTDSASASASSVAAPGQQFAQFGAGCFWGVELVFQRIPGVRSGLGMIPPPSIARGMMWGRSTDQEYTSTHLSRKKQHVNLWRSSSRSRIGRLSPKFFQ